jgi:hypothetical protein
MKNRTHRWIVAVRCGARTQFGGTKPPLAKSKRTSLADMTCGRRPQRILDVTSESSPRRAQRGIAAIKYNREGAEEREGRREERQMIFSRLFFPSFAPWRLNLLFLWQEVERE